MFVSMHLMHLQLFCSFSKLPNSSSTLLIKSVKKVQGGTCYDSVRLSLLDLFWYRQGQNQDLAAGTHVI